MMDDPTNKLQRILVAAQRAGHPTVAVECADLQAVLDAVGDAAWLRATWEYACRQTGAPPPAQPVGVEMLQLGALLVERGIIPHPLDPPTP